MIGSPKSHRHVTVCSAQRIEGVVFALDYRLAPEAPFPRRWMMHCALRELMASLDPAGARSLEIPPAVA